MSEYCGGDIDALLEEGKHLVQDLQLVTSHVSKCFNPSYDIISFYLREYHRQFHSILSSFCKRADELTAHQIISLGMLAFPLIVVIIVFLFQLADGPHSVRWVVKFYEKQLLKLGVTKPQPPLVTVLEILMESYRLHIRVYSVSLS